MTTVVLNTTTRKVEVFSSARDVQARAEIAAHKAAVDPHPQYLAEADDADIATSGDATDLVSGTVPDGRMPIWTDYAVATKAALEASTIPPRFEAVSLLGYSEAGDGGGALYKRAASEPSHEGKIQSQDGAWWELAEKEPTARMFGAKADGTTDDSSALKRAMESVDTLYLDDGHYRLETPTEKEVLASTTSGSEPAGVLEELARGAGVWVGPNQSLIGRGDVKLSAPESSGFSSIIGLRDWDNGVVSGIEVAGADATTGGMAGIFSYISPTGPRISRNVRMNNLYIHDVGNYGIGWQYGHIEGAYWTNIRIKNVGVDGIDHKVRFGPTSETYPLEGTGVGIFMDNIHVENPCVRLTDHAGLDLRGSIVASNIVVTELGNASGLVDGIRFASGSYKEDEWRVSSRGSSLTSWRVEAKNPTYETFGLRVHSSGPVTVGPGSIKGCRVGVFSHAKSVTPYGFHSGPIFTGVIVEGARDNDATKGAFWVHNHYTQLIGCQTIADVQIFEADRGNLEAGQTNFAPVGGINTSTAGYVVLKNGTELTLTTDYTEDGTDGIILNSGVLATDVIWIVNKTINAVRVDGDNCQIVGHHFDEWCGPFSFASDAVFDSGTFIGNHDHSARLSARHVSDRLELTAAGDGTDISIKLEPKGDGHLWTNGSFLVGDLSTYDEPVSGHAFLHIGGFAAGTTAPNGELVLGHASVLSPGNVLGQVSFYSSDNSSDATGRQAAIKAITSGSTGASAHLAFFAGLGSNDADSSVERMRITPAGDVGVGETAPDYKLDVNGSFGFAPGASVTPADNGYVVFELTNDTTLTIKAKVSDGTVRSGTVSLA